MKNISTVPNMCVSTLRCISMSEAPAVSTAPGEHLPVGGERQVVMAVGVSCQLHRLPGAQAVDERGSLRQNKRADF